MGGQSHLMNELRLQDSATVPAVLSGDGGRDTFTAWFWFKAGACFTLGAGAVYTVAQIMWIMLVVKNPGLIWARLFFRL
jgi:hypothetical protein